MQRSRQFRGRYATPELSNIEVTVKAQENVLANFELE